MQVWPVIEDTQTDVLKQSVPARSNFFVVRLFYVCSYDPIIGSDKIESRERTSSQIKNYG